MIYLFFRESKNEQRSELCTEAPAVYQSSDFTTTALQHSKVKLTWDQDDPDRVKITRRKFTKDEIQDMDFKAYLASESDDEDGEDDEEEQQRILKYKSLLTGSGDEDDSQNVFKDDKKPNDIDMEITFTPGLSEAAAKKLRDKKEMEVWVMPQRLFNESDNSIPRNEKMRLYLKLSLGSKRKRRSLRSFKNPHLTVKPFLFFFFFFNFRLLREMSIFLIT